MPLYPSKDSRVLPGMDPRDLNTVDIAPGNFGQGLGLTLQQYLPYIIIINGDSVSHTLTLTLRGSGVQFTGAVTIQPGGPLSFPTSIIKTISLDSSGTAADVSYVYSDLPLVGPSFAAGSGIPISPYAINVDGSGNLGTYYNGTEVLATENSGAFDVPIANSPPSTTNALAFRLFIDSNGHLVIGAPNANFDSEGTVEAQTVFGWDQYGAVFTQQGALGLWNLASGSAASIKGLSLLELSAEGLVLMGIDPTNGNTIQFDPNGDIPFYSFNTGSSLFQINNGTVQGVKGIGTVADGIPPFRGIDDRSGVTSTDGSPIAVYAVPSTTGKFRITVGLVGESGTISSAVYTIKYTDTAGNTITHTVSISAVSTDASLVLLVQPEASTNITAQLTTLTGTGTPTVDVTCLVEGVSAGT